MQLPFALARRFVAGPTLESALPALDPLLDDGLFITLDLLGEHVHDRTKAQGFADAYGDLVERLATYRDARGVAPEAVGISIKLSMIGQVIDRDTCERNLRDLLARAKEADLFVRLDMEGTDITQSTLDFFEAVYPDFPDHVGPVLQAYLLRTAADVARMCELDARVRLCKGAYKEPASLAHQDMPTIRWHYRQHAQALLTGARYPGIATHDDELIAAVRQLADERGVARDAFEFQMLYGLRPETQRQMVQDGYRMRVYVPYGTEWLPYFSRRIRERKENAFFVLKALVQG
ncbi:proline dehydrogenase family protein [Rubrivirga sp. IMCC45206]|uniref:proline dehydrogenase family protein n=1 Tax=Rubrivirga sp. IMCC45206 TaxID=3391614 RepID=UPI00398FB7D5